MVPWCSTQSPNEGRERRQRGEEDKIKMTDARFERSIFFDPTVNLG